MSETTVLQPAEIFKMLKVKNQDEAQRVLDVAFKLLVYLKPGDKIKTGGSTFTKLDSDTIHINVKVSPEDIADVLDERRIIRIPT